MQKLAGLLALVCVVSACGDDDGHSGPPGHSLKMVVSSVRISSPPGEYASDLDNDGEEDDQLGRVAASLAAAGDVDLQSGIDAAIADGETLLLVEVASHDEDFADDSGATLTIHRAMAQANPSFTGDGTFTIDPTGGSIVLEGIIKNRVFTSNQPSGAPQPLPLGLGFAGAVIEVPVIGVLVRVTIDAEAQTLVAGRLAGGILLEEVESAIFPLLAESYNTFIAAEPGSPDAVVLLNLFDDGGDDCGGIANNGVIEVCEIASNGLIQNIFAADVALLSNGVLAPSPSRTPKDCMSLGVGFSGVAAAY